MKGGRGEARLTRWTKISTLCSYKAEDREVGGRHESSHHPGGHPPTPNPQHLISQHLIPQHLIPQHLITRDAWKMNCLFQSDGFDPIIPIMTWDPIMAWDPITSGWGSLMTYDPSAVHSFGDPRIYNSRNCIIIPDKNTLSRGIPDSTYPGGEDYIAV